MIIPVRCFTCGNVIGHNYEIYKQQVAAGRKADEVLNELGVERYCCRRMIIANADLIEEVLYYP